MTIYIDIVFLINLFFDFLLLLGVSIILKRDVKIYRIFLGSLVGSSTIILLFASLTSLELFLYKVIVSILMCISSFNYVNLKYTIKNIIYLYMVSVFLGGFLYVVNSNFSIKQEGLIFYNNGFSINIVLIIILTPLILFFYIKQSKNLKNNYNNYYKIHIYFNDYIINSVSYLDTGNCLINPYTLKPVIILNNKDPIFNTLNYTLIPYNTIDNKGLIKCFKSNKVYIEGIGYRYNVSVCIIENKLNIDGITSIIGLKLLEGK